MSQIKPKPLKIGELSIWPPVVLAPMAGITHYPFRKLCKSFGNCLTVSEMVTARPLVENSQKTLKIAQFGADETPRSIQLYGIDPYYMGEAVKRLVGEGKVDHIDLNFGCPVKKVTRRGGGSALPYKVNLLRAIVRQAVTNAGNIPVTLKCRMGINPDILTYHNTGLIAQEEGCKAISLHGRTASQLYTGMANWQAIAELKANLQYISVLGNGDIFTAQDALDMMVKTNCDGVVIGRGCLGKPWLFRDLEDTFNNKPIQQQPKLSEVIAIMLTHLDYMVAWFGEKTALLKFRRDACYYLKGFHSSAKLRELIMTVNTVDELNQFVTKVSIKDERVNYKLLQTKNGRSDQAIHRDVTLPYGYLDDKYSIDNIDLAAESDISGG